VIETYASGINIEMGTLPDKSGRVDVDRLDGIDFDSTACVVVQSPGFFGLIEDIKGIGKILKGKKALFIIIANPISLAFLTSPGEAEADLAVGEMQVFGNSLNFGGPYVGYFAAKKEYVRKIPGRLVARTKDVDGNVGYVLTLQTREQHIRRDKATSNICTNQALCALAAAVHLSLLGEKGIRGAAEQSVKKAHYLAERLQSLTGFSLVYNGRFFNEFAVKVPIDACDFAAIMERENILAGVPLGRFYPDRKDQILVAVTEKRSKAELDHYIETASKLMQTSGISAGLPDE
jgi:glycine dehydrogenase subunit 1